MAHYLLKTEPSEYSFADLARDKRTTWSGISNAAALIHLRAIRRGDLLVVYHTGDEKQAVGLAQAAGDPYPDPALDDPRRAVVDIRAGRALPQSVPLATFRKDPVLRTTELVRFTRLSVSPLTDLQFARLLQLAGA